jgi:hypothetical protein
MVNKTWINPPTKVPSITHNEHIAEDVKMWAVFRTDDETPWKI